MKTKTYQVEMPDGQVVQFKSRRKNGITRAVVGVWEHGWQILGKCENQRTAANYTRDKIHARTLAQASEWKILPVTEVSAPAQKKRKAPKRPNNEQVAVLIEFAREHSPHWKRELNAGWLRAAYPGALQQVRNNFGPEWLERVTFAHLQDWQAEATTAPDVTEARAVSQATEASAPAQESPDQENGPEEATQGSQEDQTELLRKADHLLGTVEAAQAARKDRPGKPGAPGCCVRCGVHLSRFPGGTHGRCSFCEESARKEVARLRREGLLIEDPQELQAKHGERCGLCSRGRRVGRGLVQCDRFHAPRTVADKPKRKGCFKPMTRIQEAQAAREEAELEVSKIARMVERALEQGHPEIPVSQLLDVLRK